jgi:acetoacetate decarboxylase
MAKIRYVKTLEQVKRAQDANPEFLESTVRTIRTVYETDPAIARVVIPKPLEPCAAPEVHLHVSEITMHLAPDVDMKIGSAIFGVGASYEGVDGIYLLTMPMTTEQAVVPGRETYGEPKKIADIALERSGDDVVGTVTRMGSTYLEVRGRIGASLGPRSLVDRSYCYKVLPSCEQGKAFDHDPLLVRLEWRHEHDAVHRMNGEVILRDSIFDPVADIPVRRIVRMEYEEGRTQSNGQVLRSVPGDWILPFLHQRYDDASGDGVDVAV